MTGALTSCKSRSCVATCIPRRSSCSGGIPGSGCSFTCATTGIKSSGCQLVGCPGCNC